MFDECSISAKIRRLYDIANILATLNLIRKIRITEIRDRKPTYQYIGPDIDNLRDLNGTYLRCLPWLHPSKSFKLLIEPGS